MKKILLSFMTLFMSFILVFQVFALENTKDRIAVDEVYVGSRYINIEKRFEQYDAQAPTPIRTVRTLAGGETYEKTLTHSGTASAGVDFKLSSGIVIGIEVVKAEIIEAFGLNSDFTANVTKTEKVSISCPADAIYATIYFGYKCDLYGLYGTRVDIYNLVDAKTGNVIETREVVTNDVERFADYLNPIPLYYTIFKMRES